MSAVIGSGRLDAQSHLICVPKMPIGTKPPWAQIEGSARALVITRSSHDCRRGPASAVALADPIVW